MLQHAPVIGGAAVTSREAAALPNRWWLLMASPGRIRMRRPGTPGPRGGGVYVTELQRARLLDAAFAVVSEPGSCAWASLVAASAPTATQTFQR